MYIISNRLKPLFATSSMSTAEHVLKIFREALRVAQRREELMNEFREKNKSTFEDAALLVKDLIKPALLMEVLEKRAMEYAESRFLLSRTQVLIISGGGTTRFEYTVTVEDGDFHLDYVEVL